jgi:hypothetical protein
MSVRNCGAAVASENPGKSLADSLRVRMYYLSQALMRPVNGMSRVGHNKAKVHALIIDAASVSRWY